MDIYDISECTVIICDDSITNVMVLSKLMESDDILKLHTVTDPRKLLPLIGEIESELDLLVLDIEMPHMTGIQVLEALNQKYMGHRPFSVLVITGSNDRQVRNSALLAGANDFLEKPFDPLEVVLRTRNLLQVQLAFRQQQQAAQRLEREVARRTVELDRANELLVNLLGMAGELRDHESREHVIRIGKFARLVAEALDLPAELCFLIEKAAPLHDIGKIGVPDSVLHKQELLEPAEREVMNSHTRLGFDLLGAFDHDSLLIQMAAGIASNHHERWNGSGYPRGLKGESIPVESRIVAVVDVFDALTTRRTYKAPSSLDEAIGYLKAEAGVLFDPQVVAAFCSNIDRVREIISTYPDPD